MEVKGVKHDSKAGKNNIRFKTPSSRFRIVPEDNGIVY